MSSICYGCLYVSRFPWIRCASFRRTRRLAPSFLKPPTRTPPSYLKSCRCPSMRPGIRLESQQREKESSKPGFSRDSAQTSEPGKVEGKDARQEGSSGEEATVPAMARAPGVAQTAPAGKPAWLWRCYLPPFDRPTPTPAAHSSFVD